MTDREIQVIVVVIVGLIILALVIKLWRIILGLGVVAAIIIGILCSKGEIDCPFNPRNDGGSGSLRSSLTQEQAIGQVKAYLARVSAPTTQQRKVPRTRRRPCRDYGPDVYKEDCKKRYRTEIKWTSETTWELETLQLPGLCRRPPRGGMWSATFNNFGRTWSVINTQSGHGQRFSWTVNDGTGAVTSHQPPC